jgi:hypothetical protein
MLIIYIFHGNWWCEKLIYHKDISMQTDKLIANLKIPWEDKIAFAYSRAYNTLTKWHNLLFILQCLYSYSISKQSVHYPR